MKIFTIYDSKAEAYLQPFFSPTKATATRDFQQAAQDEKSAFHTHAADYTLMQIGAWNEQTGTLSVDETKSNLGTALDYMTAIQTPKKLEVAS